MAFYFIEISHSNIFRLNIHLEFNKDINYMLRFYRNFELIINITSSQLVSLSQVFRKANIRLYTHTHINIHNEYFG